MAPRSLGHPDATETTASSPWAADADALLETWRVDQAKGLSLAEVEARLSEYGPNTLEFKHGPAWWMVLLNQFKGVLTLLLGGAAGLSALFGQWAEAVAILVVLA